MCPRRSSGRLPCLPVLSVIPTGATRDPLAVAPPCRIDPTAFIAARRGRSNAADVDARVDLEGYADALLAAAERAVPVVARLDEDVRTRQVRPVLRALGDALLRATRTGEADPTLGPALRRGVTDLVAVWGLSVDDLAMVLSLAGSAMVAQLLRDRSATDLLDAVGRTDGVARLLARVVAAAEEVAGEGRGQQEREVRERLGGGASAGVEPADDERWFVVRCAEASVRDHAVLARSLRDRGVTAATGSDHVVGTLGPDTALPPIEGAVVVIEEHGRAADPEARRRSLLEVADAADRVGASGVMSDHDLLPHRLLLGAPAWAASLRARVAAIREGGPALIEAAAAFCRTGSVPDAAAMLGVHRETTRARLKRVERLGALDLRTSEDRAVLHLALLAAALDPAPAAPAPAGRRPRPSTARAAFEAVDRDALTERAVAILRRRALASGLDGSVDEVRRAPVREGLAEVLRLLQEDEAAPWVAMTAAGKRRLGQLACGVPVADAHEAFAELVSLTWRAVVDAAPREDRPALAGIVDRHWALATATHAVLDLGRSSGGSCGDALRSLLDGVGRDVPRHVLAARAHAAGLELDGEYRALAVVAGRASTASALAMTLRGAGWAAVAQGREVQAIVAADVTDAALRTLLPVRSVGCASEVASLLDLVAVLTPLRRLVAARNDGRRGLLDPGDEVLALLVLQRPDLASMLERRVMGALAGHNPARGVDLVTTLVGYVGAGLRRGPTAAALHLHPNSVDYRLRTIEHRTGLSFARPEDVLVLSLAVVAHRLSTAGATP